MRNSTQKQEINRRRQVVSKLRHEGVREQAEIVRRLSDDYGIEVSQQTVSIDLKALDKLWKSSALANTDKWKKEVLSQYRYLYQQSLAAWEMSLEDAEEKTIDNAVTTDGVRSGNLEPAEKTKLKGQSGNPAHIRNAQESLKAIREMVGLDKPALVDIPKDSNFEAALKRAYGQDDSNENSDDQPNP